MIWHHNEHDRLKSKHPVSRNVNSISFACLSWCFFLMHSLNVNLISFACLSWRKPPTDLRLMSPQQPDYVQGPASGFWKTRFPKRRRIWEPFPERPNLPWSRTPPSSRSCRGCPAGPAGTRWQSAGGWPASSPRSGEPPMWWREVSFETLRMRSDRVQVGNL